MIYSIYYRSIRAWTIGKMVLKGLWTKQSPHRPACDRKWGSMVTERWLSSWAKARPLKSSDLRVVYLTSCTFLCFTTTVSYPLFLPIIYSNHNGRRWMALNSRNQLHTQLSPVSCYDSLNSSKFVTAQEMRRWQREKYRPHFLTPENNSVVCREPTWMWELARVTENHPSCWTRS